MAKYEQKFSFPIFLRSFTIILALLALAWSIYYILFSITASTRWFQKLAPFVVILLSVRVLYKNLLTTNSIVFYDKFLKLTYILRKPHKLPYNKIKKLEFKLKPRKIIVLTYEKDGGEVKIKIPRGISGIVKAINSIVKKSPQVKLDEFLASVVIQEKHKK